MKYPKEILKEIKAIKAKIPIQKTGSKVKTYSSIRGKDIIVSPENPGKDDKGNPINPDSFYIMTTEGTPVNHERRMKDAYKKSGRVGILLYFEAYVPPGPLKLEIWQQISAITKIPISEELALELNPKHTGSVTQETNEET